MTFWEWLPSGHLPKSVRDSGPRQYLRRVLQLALDHVSFVKVANIVASSNFFMPGRSDKQAEGTQKKRNRLEAGGFCVLLSKTTYICDGPGLNNLLWAEVLKFIHFRTSIPFKENRMLVCGKNPQPQKPASNPMALGFVSVQWVAHWKSFDRKFSKLFLRGCQSASKCYCHLPECQSRKISCLQR